MSRLQQQAIVIGDSFNNTLGLIRSLGEAKVLCSVAKSSL